MNPFPDQPLTAAGHFWLYQRAAVLHILNRVAEGYETWQAMFEEYPFLAEYNNQIITYGVKGLAPSEALRWWLDAICVWEERVAGHLPLRALRIVAELPPEALTLLIAAGLVEDDARFGTLFEDMQGEQRPTAGLLQSWWRNPLPGARDPLRQLTAHGLLHGSDSTAPQRNQPLHVLPALWDALRGFPVEAAGLRHIPVALLPTSDALIVSDAVRERAASLLDMLAETPGMIVLVRGPQHNGRHTLLRALARALGRAVLEVEGAQETYLGALATLLHAMPVFTFNVPTGETVPLPPMNGCDGPLGVVLGKQGGVLCPEDRHTVTLTLDMPDAELRRQHWTTCLGENGQTTAFSERFRLASGAIRRVANLATTYARLDGGAQVGMSHIRQASQAVDRQALEALAVYVPVQGDWSHLAASSDTMDELRILENRCRYRERLPGMFSDAMALSVGIRALFTGASGTGKTLAARLLAASLDLELYRVDLSSVVNKYIGETEKNLNRLFTQAEERDIVLLIDEGDALLTRRTDVSSANDRYANLETNFLLQRLESYEGIVVITTNSAERIDSAFQRRMDVVIEFRLPEAAERWSIWHLHLPREHQVESAPLQEIAGRCALSGGQIRNAALHAATLALQEGSPIRTTHLVAAVQREYRKAGQMSPLRRSI